MNHIEQIENEVMLEIKNAEIVVDDPASMEIASEMVLNLDNMKKKVVEYWADTKKKAYDAWKNITTKEKEMLDPIDSARDGLKRKINAYLTEQKRKEDEERRKLEEERRRKEDEERRKLEEERLKKEEAEKLAAEGKTEEAAQVAQEAEAIAVAAEAVYIPPEVPEMAIEKTTRTDNGSVSGKEELSIEVRNKKELIQAMLNDGLLEVIEVKESKLKQWLKLTGKESYPGLGIQKVINAAFRGKKSAYIPLSSDF